MGAVFLSTQPEMQVITTPTFDWLAERARGCNSRMLIGSPYVNDGVIQLTDLVSDDVSRTLVTRTDLRDFAFGSSSLDTLCTLSGQGVVVRSLSSLHAKMYVFDDEIALVTSANATTSGLWRNLECGLSTKNKQMVKDLSLALLSGFGAEVPPREMRREELYALNSSVSAIRATLPKPLTVVSKGDQLASEPRFSISDKEAFLEGFDGWQRLTLEGVLAMPESGFRLDDLLKVCAPMAAARYPNNRHVPEKLRQQLQMLRDVGVVEFVAPGQYRHTMD